MNLSQYSDFKKILENSQQTIVKNSQIFITTCNFSINGMIRELDIQRVIMDEASQANEI